MEVWADEVPLYIWSAERADLSGVKAAKKQLEHERDHLGGIQSIPARLRPVGVAAPSDLPTHDTRVLAIGSRPPFLCDYALCHENTKVEGWVRALCWVLGIAKYDEKATMMVDTLTSIFGPGFREIHPDVLTSEERLAAYQRGEH